MRIPSKFIWHAKSVEHHAFSSLHWRILLHRDIQLMSRLQTFKAKKVEWLQPDQGEDGNMWFNILVLHQNKVCCVCTSPCTCCMYILQASKSAHRRWFPQQVTAEFLNILIEDILRVRCESSQNFRPHESHHQHTSILASLNTNTQIRIFASSYFRVFRMAGDMLVAKYKAGWHVGS